MSDDLTISGGVAGIAAHQDDLLSHAAILDGVGRDFEEVAATLASINLSPDIAEAAVLCPIEVAEAEAALVAANLGPDGAAVAWAKAEVSAEFLRFSVNAYCEVDTLMAEFVKQAEFAAGVAVGYLEPSMLATPALVQGDDIQAALYEHPWLQEVVARGAPGYVQGVMLSFGGIGLVPLLSGGNWPTPDLQGALRGLVAIGAQAGVLQDSGTFAVRRLDQPSPHLDLSSDRFISHVITEQQLLAECEAQVQIVKVDNSGGPAYLVQIPGTQDWGSVRGRNPVDLTTNVNLAAGNETKLVRAVVDAMREEHIPAGAPVMLSGHSQGGMVAADIASNPRYRNEFNIQAVLTAGSPIGHAKIPSHVSVMSLEEKQDLVPKLDGVDNPDAPNWVTVTRDLAAGAADPHHDLAAAHSLVNYQQTAGEVDRSDQAAVAAWRDQNREFFGMGSARRYAITRVGD
ncbi:MAG TPA: hypothetical protein VN108_04045 [Marmoricola sp.]|nr:hypothetical protein [Marmoricola sp.]